MSKSFTAEELAKHNKEGDAYLAIKGGVYDISEFAAEHPGGKKVIMKMAGKESTKKFDMFHDPEVLEEFGAELKIGTFTPSKL